METLDINRLIEVAEELVYNGLINNAEQGKAKVQDIRISGKYYTIELIIKRESKTVSSESKV